MGISKKTQVWIELISIIVVILSFTFFITSVFIGCSKDDDFLEPTEELLDTINTQVSQIIPPNSQDVAVIYEFYEEYMVQDGMEYPNPILCPITYNNITMSGGFITITTDCSLTDGVYVGAVLDMEFTTDEILVLGEGGIFSHPKTIQISVCTDETVILTHERPELNQIFFFVYKS